MDQDGFAARSGKLQLQDRILACNGVDFTKELTNSRVEEIFTQMSREPLLRMAISRGAQTDIQYTQSASQDEGAEPVEGGVKEGAADVDPPGTPKIGTCMPTHTNTYMPWWRFVVTLLKKLCC